MPFIVKGHEPTSLAIEYDLDKAWEWILNL